MSKYNDVRRAVGRAVLGPVWRAVGNAVGRAAWMAVGMALRDNNTTWYPEEFNNPKL